MNDHSIRMETPRADLKETTQALCSSVRTANRALREVERLKRQRRILARHVAIFRDRLDLAQRIIAALEKGGEVALVWDLRGVIQSRDEEIAHLRTEVADISQRLLAYRASVDKDTDSVLQESWEMAKRLRASDIDRERLLRQRRILSGHLRSELRASSSWKRMAIGLNRKLRSSVSNLVRYETRRRQGSSIQSAFNISRKFIQRLFWALIVGWRGSAEVQEALHG